MISVLSTDLTASYQLISELLLNPSERDPEIIKTLQEQTRNAAVDIENWIDKFLADPASSSGQEYVHTLELSPPCPLYLGAHLFDEPTTCNGVGSSGRNAYMMELAGIYGHFGFDISGKELPDFLPAMVDFLWLSLDNHAQDGIGLRRRFVEQYVAPGINAFKKSLEKFKSPYALLVCALQCVVQQDIEQMADGPVWKPPVESSSRGFSLPVLSTMSSEFSDPNKGAAAIKTAALSELSLNGRGSGDHDHPLENL